MWTNKYIGIPYKDAGDDENGLDCWGLVRLVYKNEFNIDLPSFAQTRLDAYELRSAIIDEYKQDGWTEVAEPSSGAVVLVRVQGLPIHTGVMVDSTKFLNILPGANCVIADITDNRWRNRIIGFYKYTPNSHSIILTGAPHPLRTQVYSMPVMAGHTLAEISNIIASTYKVPPNIINRTVLLVNGRPVPQESWSNFKLVCGDRVEYRTRAGIETLIAEFIYYLTYGELFAASAAAGEIYAAATAAEALAAAGVISSTGLAIASAAATILISTGISYALAPPRPKLNTNDPGNAEAQLLATGNANQLSRYGTIPIVLGKMKVVPPLGAINYISYFGADERDSYLSMLLTWGYGPLKLYGWKPNSVLKEPAGSSTPSYYKWAASSTGTQYSGLKLGNNILDNYTIDAIIHKNIYDGDYVAGATNQSKESDAGFNSIYGQDHNQQFKNQAIVNDIHPLNGDGSVANPTLTAVEATVPNLGNSITNTSEFYNRIEIALHFPEGLRKIRVKGDNDNIGKSYALMEGVSGAGATSSGRSGLISSAVSSLSAIDSSKIPLLLKFEYKLGAVTTPASSATGYLPLKVKDKFGNITSDTGIMVLGDISYKDAFTRVYYADDTITQVNGSKIFPFKGEISVRVTRLTGDRGEAPAEGTTEYNTWGGGSVISDRGFCQLAQTEYTTDGAVDIYSTASSYTNRADCLAANSSALYGQRYEWVVIEDATTPAGSVALAKDWRILHKVNFLSFTASRNSAVLVSPKARTTSSVEDVQFAHTALRLNSSEQLNGQLEGINGIVQTLGLEYTGTDPTILDLSKWVANTPINNPASLFLHVLLSPANPKRILWSEITTKVDLIKIQKWWWYCNNRPEYTFPPDSRKVGGKFTYNQVIGQAKSVLDILKDICAAGRASPAQVDGKWTVHIDEIKPNIVQMFTPHNSWDFNSTRNLDKAPDGLRISFYDEDNDYQEAEIIVYNKDKTESNAILFESINLPGITKASLAEDHAKWHMAQAIVRRELYTLNTDLEYLICNRGDRVTVTHDVPMWGYGSGRILRRGTFNASFHTLVVDLDEPVILDPSKAYGIKIRSSSFSNQSVERTIVTSGMAFQSISRALDGFTVTVVTGSQYAPVTVGDKIVINSTGDFSTTSSSPAIVTSVNDTTTPLSFTYIKAGTASATAGAGTIDLTNGLYRRIQFDSIVGTYTGTKKDGTTTVTVNLAEEGDLFLFGEYQKVSNDLLVLAIEPDTNKGARLTLVDYAYKSLFELYPYSGGISGTATGVPAYLSQTANLIFRPNIAAKNDLAGFTEDDSAPEIGEPTSDISSAEVVSPGVYNYRIKLPYANRAGGAATTIDGITINQLTTGTPTDITHVECEYALNTTNAEPYSIKVPWLTCTVYISNVQVGQSYKMRLRYVKRDGRVGKWSAYKYHTVIGATVNYSGIDSVSAYLSGTDLAIVPNMLNKPVDFKWFEVRIWKDSAPLTYDFWDYSTNNLMTNSQPNDTKVFRIIRSSDPQGLKTDLKTFGNPGTIISTAGVRYKIACRAWDGRNYSSNSAVTTWFGTTVAPGKYTIVPAAASLNLLVTPPSINGRLRTDLWGMKVWMSKPVTDITTKVTSPANSTFVASDSNLILTTERLTAIISNLEVDKKHYFRYALISSIDPTVLTISDPYEFIPRNNTLTLTQEKPPVPKGITAEAAVTSIIVTLPTPPSITGTTQSTDYGIDTNDYTSGSSLESSAGSTHYSTVVYGIPVTSVLPLTKPTFANVQNNILGEFTEKTVFTVPADPGTAYALFFRYRNKAGNLSYEPGTGSGGTKIPTITYPTKSVHGSPFYWSISGGTPGDTWYVQTSGAFSARVPATGVYSDPLDSFGAKAWSNGDWSTVTGVASHGLITITFNFTSGAVVTLSHTVAQQNSGATPDLTPAIQSPLPNTGTPKYAEGPVFVETGINIQKFLDMLAGKITEGQLFKGLLKEIGGNRIPQIDVTAGQYTVKIDNGGHVAGFGLSNTSRSIAYDSSGNPINQLSDGSPFSEFGVVADRFWISAPAVMSNTAPTTGLHHGKRWIDTSNAGNNAGKIFGITAYYNTYKPNIHNTIVFEDNANYWYWELYTKTQLDKLIASGAPYVNKTKWSPMVSYAVNDYVFDEDSNVYYLCIKAYTPVVISNLATINPKKVGAFTGSGATFAQGKTVYIFGAERLPSGTAELAVAGTSPTYKMNPDYDSKGTFYYITTVDGSEFTLSLEEGGRSVVTGIKSYVQYYNIPLIPNPAYNLDPKLGTVDKRKEIIGTPSWVPEPASDMFPFVVETGTTAGVRPGVYIRSAYIQDASITNAKIADAAIDSAKIAYLEAGKIKGGTIDADLITAGAISIKNVDISTLRGNTSDSWTIASPVLNTSEISRTIDLPPGNYEIILTSTFGRQDEVLGSDSTKEENASIIAELTGVAGATVTGMGYWRKAVDSTKLDIKIKDKTGTISTQPTLTITDGAISFSLTAPDPPPPPPPSGGDGGGDG